MCPFLCAADYTEFHRLHLDNKKKSPLMAFHISKWIIELEPLSFGQIHPFERIQST